MIASFVIPNVRNSELSWWMYTDQEEDLKSFCSSGKSAEYV